MKKQSIIFLVLFITGLVIFSCSKDEQNTETKQGQEVTQIRSGKQGYIDHTPEESAFIHSIKVRVDAQNDFDFGPDYVNIKGTPDWDLAIIPVKDQGDYKSIIVPIIKGDKINAFFYVFDGEELTYNYIDKALIRLPFFVYVGPANHIYEEIFHFYDHVLSDTPTEDGTGYDDGIFDDPEYGGCWVTTTAEIPCSCHGHVMGDVCVCKELHGGTNPYVEFTTTAVPCDDEGGGGGITGTNTGGPTIGSGGNNNGGNNNNTNPRIVSARKAAYSVCPIIPQIACDRLQYIIDNGSDSDYCLYISTQVANLLEDPTPTNVAAANCFIMSIDLQQNPSAPNTCSNPFNSTLADLAEVYNEMDSDLISWAASYNGLNDVACNLTVAGYTAEEKNQILQAYKDHLGDAPPPTGSGDILPPSNPDLDDVNALDVIISNNYIPEIIDLIPFVLGWSSFDKLPDIVNFLKNLDDENKTWLDEPANGLHKTMVINNLIKYSGDQEAQGYIEKHIQNLQQDSEYKALVESSFGWSSIMWQIGKEIVGDKAVDILAGIVGADEVRDAIKAIKNSDWIEFSVEVSKLVLNNTPVGKFLKILDAGSEMYQLCKKIEKIWDKIGDLSEEAITKLWNIAKKSPLKINGDYLKYLDDIKFPKFGQPFASLSTYSSKFKQKFHEVSDGISQVHHAVPQAVLNKYPNLNLTQNQMHSLENLRGIPSNGALDHQTITNYWASFYNTNPNANLNEIFEFTKFIDDEFGHLFIPPVR